MNKFLFEISAWRFLNSILKRFIFKKLTKSAMPLFVKGDDDSAATLATGFHEDYLVQYFKTCAEQGLNQFFIDVGANIGLISCQVGRSFKEVHMFEPNPLLLKILEVNCKLMLDNNCQIHPFGLGNNAGLFSLTIPKNNWGGAFVKNIDNSYDESMLANKDGFAKYDANNYLTLDIKLKDVFTEMSELFSNLKSRGFTRGCFKIDVEGHEKVIMAGIVKAIPDDFDVILVLESWGTEEYAFLADKPFSERVSIGRLTSRKGWITEWNWLKAIQLIFRGSYQYSFLAGSNSSNVGDLVVSIKSVPKV